MSLLWALILFVGGLGLIVFFSERLVEGVVGTSLGFGVSAFLISVIFVGFDPENLAVGAVGSYEGVQGIALGSIIGAAMVAIALAFGITALLAPMRFEQVPRQTLVAPVGAVLLLGGLAWDGRLSRVDGALLLLGFVLAVGYLIWLSRRGFDIKPSGEVAETLEEGGALSRWRAAGELAVSLVAIIAGSELIVRSSETLIGTLGLSDTVFGMTILALLVSIEELARELPAALKGRPDISFGNVVGSILAFFLFNAGIIALVKPVAVGAAVLHFYGPTCAITVGAVTLFVLRKNVPRWAGGVLVLLYVVFFTGAYWQ